MTEALISHTNGGAVRRLWACRRFTICASHKRTSNIEYTTLPTRRLPTADYYLKFV